MPVVQNIQIISKRHCFWLQFNAIMGSSSPSVLLLRGLCSYGCRRRFDSNSRHEYRCSNRVILVITQHILRFSDVQPVCNEPESDIFLILYLIGEYSGLCNVG